MKDMKKFQKTCSVILAVALFCTTLIYKTPTVNAAEMNPDDTSNALQTTIPPSEQDNLIDEIYPSSNYAEKIETQTTVRGGGTSFSSAVEITFSSVISADIQTAGGKNYFKFRPTVSGEYVFFSFSISSGDPIVSLYNSSQGLISSDDDGGGSSQFRLSSYLVAGSTYYIEAGHYGNKTGQYNIYIIRDSNLASGKCYFQNLGTSQYLDIHGPAEQNYLHQWTFSYGDQSKWNITRTSDGYYTIQSLYGSKKYVAISTTNVNVNNVVLQSSIANSTYWKIYTNSAGQLYFEPKLAVGKVLYAPNASTGTELQLANIGTASGGKQIWNPIRFQYAYSVKHYYDNGFDVRFSWAVSELPEYQRIVSEIYLRIFGLSTNVNNIQKYVSFADLCRGTPVLLAETTASCIHTNGHKENANVVDHLIDTYGAGTSTLVNSIWTGHDLSSRAASYPLDYTILIPPDYETRADNIYTLLHETSHQLGAKDHYCFGNGVDPCSNTNCWACYKGAEAESDCIMYKLYFDIENKLLSGDLSAIYCDVCLSSVDTRGIPNHLNNHH